MAKTNATYPDAYMGCSHSRENPTANKDTDIITCCTIVALQLVLLLLLPLATLLLLMMAHWFNMTKWILMWIYCV